MSGLLKQCCNEGERGAEKEQDADIKPVAFECYFAHGVCKKACGQRESPNKGKAYHGGDGTMEELLEEKFFS